MPTAKPALTQYEAGEVFVDFEALSDHGDNTIFNSINSLFSEMSGYTPSVIPDGVISGFKITPTTVVDQVAVAAGKCYLAGAEDDISAALTETVVRAASTDTHMINSVQVTSVGAISIVTGTDGTAFSEVRDAEGGPPLILVGSIEVGQVRLTADTTGSAVVLASEIKQVVGTHQERWDSPGWNITYGQAPSKVLGLAGIVMDTALPLSHTGAIPKGVYTSYYTPTMADIPKSADFVPPSSSHSVTTEEYYSGEDAYTSTSVGQGSLTVKLTDGISDGIMGRLNNILCFRFYPDRLKDPYILCRGLIGGPPNFPMAAGINVKLTISAVNTYLGVTS